MFIQLKSKVNDISICTLSNKYLQIKRQNHFHTYHTQVHSKPESGCLQKRNKELSVYNLMHKYCINKIENIC